MTDQDKTKKAEDKPEVFEIALRGILDQPDDNGNIITREAMENALAKFNEAELPVTIGYNRNLVIGKTIPKKARMEDGQTFVSIKPNSTRDEEIMKELFRVGFEAGDCSIIKCDSRIQDNPRIIKNYEPIEVSLFMDSDAMKGQLRKQKED